MAALARGPYPAGVRTRAESAAGGLAGEAERAAALEVVRRALAEDVGPGDLTTTAVVPEQARAKGRLIAKQDGVLAGTVAFELAFAELDPGCRVAWRCAEGEAFAAGDVLATVEGRARALLTAERTALNLLQRLSGVATTTARYVEAACGRARVLDTRKTTPGLRLLEKAAVRAGGGENHRVGLFDEVMIKDNHIDLAGTTLEEAVRAARAAVGDAVRITVEARDEDEALAAARAGADVVMLDNMPPDRMEALVPRLRAAARPGGRPLEIEASGGVTLATIAHVAATGVDRISVGALTHSAPAIDLSLALEPVG